jgi:predicted O-linked N-acetylglucosamine transferase (SPINDLY family)
MEPTSFFISYSRLAPIQVLTFGHPDTSGVSTIDYFLSHENMDKEDGQQYYSETLVRLKGIGWWKKALLPLTYHPRVTYGMSDAQLNINGKGHLAGKENKSVIYLLTKSVQFYSPDFIEVLGQILASNENSILAIVMDTGKASRGYDIHNECQESVLDRIEQKYRQYSNIKDKANDIQQNEIYDDIIQTLTMPSPPPADSRSPRYISGRVRFLDKGDHDYFMNLLHISDVLLQPFPLDGTTTTLETITMGLPIVAMKNEMIGGRMAYGIYAHMEFTETMATTKEEYVQIAVKLGEKSYNDYVRKEIIERRERFHVFEDKRAITNMEQWIEQVVQAESKGQKWKPTE